MDAREGRIVHLKCAEALASVAWWVEASFFVLKYHGFDSPFRHLPSLWVWCPTGPEEAANQCFSLTLMFFSLSLTLSSFLSL